MVVTTDDFIREGSGVVTLCGSTKFFFEAMEANRILTFNNWMVFQCGSWGHSFNKYSEQTPRDFEQIKKLHFQKILFSDLVVVVTDSSNYIGSSTKAELKFSKQRGTPILWYDGDKFFEHKQFLLPNKPIPKELEDTSIIDNFEKTNEGLGF